MEPVTHVLTGACLARAGLNRRVAYATLAMAVAAEFPDVDYLWSLRGPVELFTHHRGITHTLLGLPFEAAFLTGLVYLLHRWRVARAAATSQTRPLTAAPVRWGGLCALILLALSSHLVLDFTNSYGVRPFFPFNPHWYAASIVFIFDPLAFGLLVASLILPAILRLVNSEISARRPAFNGHGFARAALVLIVAYCGVRWWEHGRALDAALAESVALTEDAAPVTTDAQQGVSVAPRATMPAATESLDEPHVRYRPPDRVLANPDPLDPRRWYVVADYGEFYRLGTANLRTGTIQFDGRRQQKLSATPALAAAFAAPLGRAYLDWSPMPFLTVREGALAAGEPPSGPGHRTVTFADPRFMGETLLLHSSGHTPLTGEVELDRGNRVVGQAMDNHVEPRR